MSTRRRTVAKKKVVESPEPDHMSDDSSPAVSELNFEGDNGDHRDSRLPGSEADDVCINKGNVFETTHITTSNANTAKWVRFVKPFQAIVVAAIAFASASFITSSLFDMIESVDLSKTPPLSSGPMVMFANETVEWHTRKSTQAIQEANKKAMDQARLAAREFETEMAGEVDRVKKEMAAHAQVHEAEMLELSSMLARLREDEEHEGSENHASEAGRTVVINQLQQRLTTQSESLERMRTEFASQLDSFVTGDALRHQLAEAQDTLVRQMAEEREKERAREAQDRALELQQQRETAQELIAQEGAALRAWARDMVMQETAAALAAAGSGGGMSDSDVREAVDRYSSEREGRLDYAQRVAGASIVYGPSFTTPSLHSTPGTDAVAPATHSTSPRPWLSRLSSGLFAGATANQDDNKEERSSGDSSGNNVVGPSRGIYNVPELVTTPSTTPGSCWAFAGSRGRITIRLAAALQPDTLVLHHAPHSSAHNITAAPRDIQVWGVGQVGDAELGSGADISEEHALERRELLGSFTYVTPGADIQSFPLQTGDGAGAGPAFRMIMLQVDSNWGNLDYTCIYRVRVHGTTLV